jgi:hypothetical protein
MVPDATEQLLRPKTGTDVTPIKAAMSLIVADEKRKN